MENRGALSGTISSVIPLLLPMVFFLLNVGCSGGSEAVDIVADLTVDHSTSDVQEVAIEEASVFLDSVASTDLALPDPASCDPRLLAAGQVRAKPVVCIDELPGGPKAIGRVGDMMLENSQARFIIRAGAGHTFVGLDGGTVVDADLARPPGEPGQDRLQEIIPLFSFNTMTLETLEIISHGDDGEAIVSASGTAVAMPYLANLLPILPELDGTITYEYRLKADSPVLTMRTRVSLNDAPGGATVMPIDGFFASGALQGFDLGALGADKPMPALVSHMPGISYGFLGSEGYEMTSLGAVALATGSGVEVSASGEVTVERYLIVGNGAVSSITDQLYELGGKSVGMVSGCVDSGAQAFADSAEVVARDPAGPEVTRFRLDEVGCFSGSLPPGSFELSAVCPGCVDGDAVAVQISSGKETALESAISVAPSSGMRVTVEEAGVGAVPARLTVQPLDGGEDILLLAWPPDKLFPLPPGDYRLVAGRGFEYEQTVVESVGIKAGQIENVQLQLVRSVSTGGAIAAEFHIHSENSVDSFVPLPERVRSLAAEGMEFTASSEHDFVGDFGPAIEAEGLGAFLVSAPGVEMSSVKAGHMNCFPVVPQPDLSGNGALAWFGLPPGDIAEALMHEHPERIVIINHPRFQNESTFDLIDFDPADGEAHADPTKLGFSADTDLNQMEFDAIEVFNGIGDEELDEQLTDWYAFLNMGRKIAATAGGDSHSLDAYPGNPRNFLFVDVDDPASLTVEQVNDAVRAQRVLVSSGPYVEAGLTSPAQAGPSMPGDLVDGSSGAVELRVKVQAPTWMEVTELVLIRNGVQEQVIVIDDAGDPALRPVVRYEGSIPVSAAADSWYILRVRGTQKVDHLANHIPRAITNPFYLDADGDGEFTPPGL